MKIDRTTFEKLFEDLTKVHEINIVFNLIQYIKMILNNQHMCYNIFCQFLNKLWVKNILSGGEK